MAPVPETVMGLVARGLKSATTAAADVASSLPTLGSRAVMLQKLGKRDDFKPGSGSSSADTFNNKGFLVLFALIGTGMVLTSIWFFFWAKNGGFKWKQGDWDDYKSTVLRRKGPDGRTLSNASKSTKLGGGSVVHGGSYGRSEIGSTVYTESTGYTDKDEMRDIEAGMGIRGGDGRAQHKSKKAKDAELANYRHEKPARVGGMNREHDGSHFDYSIVGSEDPSSPPPKDKRKDKKEQERREKERRREEREAQKAADAAAKSNAKKEREQEKANRKKEKAERSRKAEPAVSVIEEEPSTRAQPLAIDNKPHRSAPSAAYSFVSGDDNATTVTSAYTVRSVPSTITESIASKSAVSKSAASKSAASKSAASKSAASKSAAPSESVVSGASQQDSYYSSYRPKAEPNTNRRSGNSSPTKSDRERHRRSESSNHRQHRSSPRHSAVGTSDIFSQNGDQSGTKSYPCYIPGVSDASVAPGESISQVGVNPNRHGRRGRDVMDGYRRSGNARRRDSLSDSEGTENV